MGEDLALASDSTPSEGRLVRIASNSRGRARLSRAAMRRQRLCRVQCAEPLGHGSVIPVGAPTGVGKFLTQRLTGSVPELNECLCQCPADGPCTVREDTTP